MGFRLVLFVPFFLLGFGYVLRYANEERLDPTASLVYDVPEAEPLVPLHLAADGDDFGAGQRRDAAGGGGRLPLTGVNVRRGLPR